MSEWDLIVGIPCSDWDMASEIPCTREDEAVAIAVGAHLAGKTARVFMQSSGYGNTIDAITSLLFPYKIVIDFLIKNPLQPEHHAYMAKLLQPLQKLMEEVNVEVRSNLDDNAKYN
jgi:sulfopyruvate decarboxylase TPP-binding subunit